MVSILDPEQKEGLGVCLPKIPCISESVVCVTFDSLLVFVNIAAVIFSPLATVGHVFHDV